MTMELIFALFALLLWCFVMGVVLNDGHDMDHLGVDGLHIANHNLYYATWISFALTSYIVADLTTVDDPSGVLPYHDEPTNQADRSWILLAIASLVLFSFNIAVGTGEICSGGILQDTHVCDYTISGTIFACVGALTSMTYFIVKKRFPDRYNPPMGIILSVVVAILFAINASLQTSPGSPGSEPSNLFWASWICFGLSFYLFVSHVEIHLAPKKTRPNNVPETSEAVVPHVQPQVPTSRVRSDYRPVETASAGSSSTSSGSTYSESTSNSTSSNDDDSSGSESMNDSDLVLLLLPSKNNESAITFASSMKPSVNNDFNGVPQPIGTQTGGGFLYEEALKEPAEQPIVRNTAKNTARPSPRGTVDPKNNKVVPAAHGGASRKLNEKSFQAKEQKAKEEKKRLLFDKMNFAPNNDGSTRGASHAGPSSKTNTVDDTSKATRTVAGSRTNRIDKSGFEKNLHQYIKGLGLPQGIFSTVSRNYRSCDSRLWLIDNSASMKELDSHLIGGSIDTIRKKDNVSRWEELRECVAFHAKMAARCWIPTKFWLVNDPGRTLAGMQQFSLCWKTPKDITSEMNQVRTIMTTAGPHLPKNPLAHQIRSVHRGISKEESRLSSQRKHVTFVISTQGVPTDRHGKTGPAVLRDCEQAFSSLSKLPVKIVLRICTDDSKVMDIYNLFDSKMNGCDVLDDYWAESIEVYLHNPWLAYGIGIHRMREAGLAWGLVDILDERPLSLHEIHRFCKSLFLGEDSHSLPQPRVWTDFMEGLKDLLDKETEVWNPVLNKRTPWINLSKLEDMYGTSQDKERIQKRRATVAKDYSRENLSLIEILQRWSHRPPSYQKLHPLDVLLVTIPDVFPPSNCEVEAHAYFFKWKQFSRDAFIDSGDGMRDLLKRGVRNAKFFLHPDKLPKDLTENQTLVFKTLWDVIAEQEEATLNN